MLCLFARPISALLASASILTLAFGLTIDGGVAVAWPVDSAGTVALDNFSSTSKDGDVMTIKHADFEGANLTREEIEKILSAGGDADEKTALVKKMKVAKMTIPVIDMAMKDGQTVHVHDILGTDIDAGKIGALGLSGIDGAGDAKSGVSFKTGAMKMEKADFSEALAMATHSGASADISQLGAFSWQNIDFTVPEKDASTPDKTIHFMLGSIDLRNDYDGATLKGGKATIKGLSVEPSKTSDLAASLATLGYTRLDFNITSAAHYEPSAKTLTIDDVTLNGDKMGSFGVKANLGDIAPDVFGSEREAQMAALMDGSISSLEVKFVNAGLFEKALGYYADQQKLTPQAMKAQWTEVAGQMLPVVLGGSPEALNLAAAAQKFIGAPTSLTIAVKPKSGTLKFMDVIALADPSTILSKLDIVATPGK